MHTQKQWDVKQGLLTLDMPMLCMKSASTTLQEVLLSWQTARMSANTGFCMNIREYTVF